MITGAAIKVGNEVYMAPAGGGVCKHREGFDKTRHCCVFNNNHIIRDRSVSGERPIQGFVTDTGEFLDRKQSGRHAFEHGQIKELTDCLMSEALW